MATNLLTPNQSGLEIDASGFVAMAATSQLSRDTSTSWQGAASLKVVTDGAAGYQGAKITMPFSSFVANGIYTFSIYAKGSGTINLVAQQDASPFATYGFATITLTAAWTRYSVRVTMPASLPSGNVAFQMATGGTAAAVTFNADGLQVESGNPATTWVLGGTSDATTYHAFVGGALVTVTPGSINVQNQIGQRSTGGLHVTSALGTIWQFGTLMQVYDPTGTLAYAGFVAKDKARKDAGLNAGQGVLDHDLTLMDNCYKADKRVVFASYLNATAGYIVNDLLGKILAAEGVTTKPGSVATGIIIPEVVWNGKRVSEALNWLATNCGFWWNIDVYNVLWFQPYGGVPAPFVLDGTQAEANDGLTVEYGNDLYVNSQYTRGAFGELKGQSDTFKGDGTRRAFTCRYGLSSKVSITVNGVAQTIGTKGKDSGQQWYWASGDATIAQDPSQTALLSTDTLVVSYNGRYLVRAVAQNPALIAAQKAREGGNGTGLVESVYVNTKVHTLPAAFQIASSLLSHYGQDTTVLEFDTTQRGLLEGQMLTVVLPDFNLNNKQMLITDVTLSDQMDGYNVWSHVRCVGSPYESAQWQTYWQSLMNQSADPSDLSDVSDTSLALVRASTVSTTWAGTVTATKTTCPICNTSTLCGAAVYVC